MKVNRILINTANIHTGGGIQVATSFIYELSRLDVCDLFNIHVWASSEVNDALQAQNCYPGVFASYQVHDLKGIKALFSPLNKEIAYFDTVFTVFGPNYLRAKARREIVGFAQAWILYNNNEVSSKWGFFKRYKEQISYKLKWCFFNRADEFVVELEHVKERLEQTGLVTRKKISIVYNAVSSVYIKPWLQTSKELYLSKGVIKLGLVSRGYPHKNLDILPYVSKELKDKYGLDVHFYVTLNSQEMLKKSSFFKSHVTSVGSLLPSECPAFYKGIDGVVFPSYLECFSSTPLEAMLMEKPLFASDRNFVRDVCAEHAIYFEPTSASSIAEAVFDYFNSQQNKAEKLLAAKNHALNFSSAKERAEKYLKIIDEV